MRQFVRSIVPLIILTMLCAAAPVSAARYERRPYIFTSDVTVQGVLTQSGSGGMTLANSESLHTDTDAIFDFTRNDAGAVTLTASDNDATAALTVLPGGAAAMICGGASMTSFTVTTDGTGTGEVVLPLQSIAGAEIVNDTIDGTELADTITWDAAVVFGGAVAFNLGNSAMTAVTVATDGTGTGEVVLPTDAISAGEITNIARSIPLPLGSWVPCAGTVPGVWDASGADTEPDLVAVNTALVIEYDDTGGSLDVDEICNTFTVPADYASGGSFVARVTQDGATANIETFSCRISVDGAAIGALNAGNNASQTAVQSVTSTPAGTWAAGASIRCACAQGNATPDDIVNIHSIEAQYTATQ